MNLYQCLECRSFLGDLLKVERHLQRRHFTNCEEDNGDKKQEAAERNSRGKLPIIKVTFPECMIVIVRNQIDPDFLKLYERVEEKSEEITVIPTGVTRSRTKSARLSRSGSAKAKLPPPTRKVTATKKKPSRSSSTKPKKVLPPAKKKASSRRKDKSLSTKPKKTKLTLQASPPSVITYREPSPSSRRYQTKSCDQCDKSFPSQRALDVHVKSIHLKNFDITRECIFCRKRFLHYRDAEIHMRSHTMERPFPCTQCDKVYPTVHNLVSHKKTHVAIRQLNFKCDLCPKRFFTLGGLNQHRLTHNGANKKFKCPICDKLFPSGRNRRLHIETHKEDHERERPFSCEMCDKRFHTAESLKSHKKSHNDKKPFQCTVCKGWFKYADYLIKHMVIHDKKRTRKFKCNVCHKGFFSEETLRGHKFDVHEFIRPFKCDTCPMDFKHRRGLKRHKMAVHEGLRPYQCQLCQQKFAYSHNLKDHNKKWQGKCVKNAKKNEEENIKLGKTFTLKQEPTIQEESAYHDDPIVDGFMSITDIKMEF